MKDNGAESKIMKEVWKMRVLRSREKTKMSRIKKTRGGGVC